VHRALESQIRRHCDTVPILSNTIRDEHFQEQYLLEDLAYFGRDIATIRPLAATERMVQAIKCVGDRCPVALIGFQYVLEGSNNGSIHIAKGVRRAYELTGTDGTKYLDPYGSTQRENWLAFKQALNETPIAPAESDLILESAKEMFRGITAMHEEMRHLISV
jgi:heme oxygenase